MTTLKEIGLIKTETLTEEKVKEILGMGDFILRCPNCNKSFNWSKAKIKNQLCEDCLKEGLK